MLNTPPKGRRQGPPVAVVNPISVVPPPPILFEGAYCFPADCHWRHCDNHRFPRLWRRLPPKAPNTLKWGRWKPCNVICLWEEGTRNMCFASLVSAHLDGLGKRRIQGGSFTHKWRVGNGSDRPPKLPSRAGPLPHIVVISLAYNTGFHYHVGCWKLTILTE